jgi:hypothetical protein
MQHKGNVVVGSFTTMFHLMLQRYVLGVEERLKECCKYFMSML